MNTEDLNFGLGEVGYTTEFEAPGDFNLHLEMSKPSSVTILQRGVSEGEYAIAKEFKGNNIHYIFDYDFGALIYPKYIKVIVSS